MKGIKTLISNGKNNEREVFLENIPDDIYHTICRLARHIGKTDPTFRSTTEYFEKNPLRTTNLTYFVRGGCPDFCGQVNRKIPDGNSIHFHDFFYIPLLEELGKRGIRIEEGKNRFDLRKIIS